MGRCSNCNGVLVTYRGNDQISNYIKDNENQVLPLGEGSYKYGKGED